MMTHGLLGRFSFELVGDFAYGRDLILKGAPHSRKLVSARELSQSSNSAAAKRPGVKAVRRTITGGDGVPSTPDLGAE